MAKIKITVSIDANFLAELDKIAKLKHMKRSNLIEEAIRVWRKEQIEGELKEGYLAMAKHNKRIAEKYLKVVRETLDE